jgi:hypothetical protein
MKDFNLILVIRQDTFVLQSSSCRKHSCTARPDFVSRFKEQFLIFESRLTNLTGTMQKAELGSERLLRTNGKNENRIASKC